MIKFKVVSDSMYPIIRIGDELLTEPVSAPLDTFDIILFKRYNKLVVHYVWRNQKNFNNTVVTRSLNNIYVDEEPVSYLEILGKVSNYKISFFKKIKIKLLCILRGQL